MIFLELVPRNLDSLTNFSQTYLTDFPLLTGINIPDVKRLDIRSYDAVSHLLEQDIPCIPHIRAQDDSIDTHINRLAKLVTQGLKHVLVISGDPIKHQSTTAFDTTPLTLIPEIKKNLPSLTIYCGLDPYRQSIEAELAYAEEKLHAGADGFFSQPFFEVSLAETVLKKLSHTQLFIGISPVIAQSSYDYWIRVNNVQFPRSFELDLTYNCNLAKDLLDVANTYSQHAYLMPIKVPVKAFLEGTFR